MPYRLRSAHLPPVMTTIPSASRVDLGPTHDIDRMPLPQAHSPRASTVPEVRLNRPLAVSYTSPEVVQRGTPSAGSSPPTMRTRPSASHTLTARLRGTVIEPVGVKLRVATSKIAAVDIGRYGSSRLCPPAIRSCPFGSFARMGPSRPVGTAKSVPPGAPGGRSSAVVGVGRDVGVITAGRSGGRRRLLPTARIAPAIRASTRRTVTASRSPARSRPASDRRQPLDRVEAGPRVAEAITENAMAWRSTGRSPPSA